MLSPLVNKKGTPITDAIIDFEAAKDRRIEAQIDADGARWNDLRRGLAELMVASEQSDTAITSAALRALLDALEAGGVNRHDGKQSIAQSLNCFSE